MAEDRTFEALGELGARAVVVTVAKDDPPGVRECSDSVQAPLGEHRIYQGARPEQEAAVDRASDPLMEGAPASETGQDFLNHAGDAFRFQRSPIVVFACFSERG